MTSADWMVLGIGIAMLAFFGAFHLWGLRVLRWVKPEQERRPHLSVLISFWGVGILHLIEIAFGACVFAFVDQLHGVGGLGWTEPSAANYLYLAGTSFATLGYTQIEASGAIRLLIMLQALTGFMLITWSATFIYQIWNENFRDS